MESFSLTIGFCWAIFCICRIFWLTFGSRREVELNSLFESYLSLGLILGFLTVVCSSAQIFGFEGNRVDFNSFQLLYSLGFLAWSPLSLVVLNETPRSLAYLPIHYILSNILCCGLTACLISDLEPYPEWPKYIFFAQGVVHLILSMIAMRQVDVMYRIKH